LIDPISSIDASSLSEPDKIVIEKLELRTALRPRWTQTVAEGTARLVNSYPDLFTWLVKGTVGVKGSANPPVSGEGRTLNQRVTAACR
jgi:hypothetical protein